MDEESIAHPAIQSMAAAIQNLLLAARALDLGACWMSTPLVASDKLKAILSVKDPWRIGAVIPVGKSDHTPSMPRRKKVKTISKFIE